MTTDLPNPDHFRRLERMYHDAPINRESRPRLRVSDGKAEIRVDIDSKMHHAAAAVHGAIYFKALDDAAFFAANSLVDDVLVLTTSFTIYMLRPVSEGRLVARGRVTHRTGRLFFAEATVEDQDEHSIARGSGTFMRSGISLGPEVRYR